VPVVSFISDDKTTLDRSYFFKLSNIYIDEESTHFYFYPCDIKQKSIELLKKYFNNSLVIGYELSEETRQILDISNVIYIDIWLHPIRFMDDNFFAFVSNSNKINDKLKKHHLSENYFRLYADKLKVQSYMGWNKYEKIVNKVLLPNSALFVGQTLTDKAICRNGQMLNVLNFKDLFTELTHKFDHVYFSRHPMFAGDDSEQIKFVTSFPNVQITTLQGYRLLISEQIKHISAISSSLVYEALFFGKSISYFYKPAINIFSDSNDNGYFSIYNKLHSPVFWSEIVSQFFDVFTRNFIVNINFFKGHSTYRDMLSLYYNNDVFDKEHFTFVKTNKIEYRKTVEQTAKIDRKIVQFMPNMISMTRIKNLIDEYPIISFDIFDTILERKCYLPSDIIKITADRIKILYDINPDVFINARSKAKNYFNKEEVSISERYKVLTRILGLPEQMSVELMRQELNIERLMLRTREIGKELFKYARTKNKKIIIISDTYFEIKFIKEILEREEMMPDKYYISSVFDKTKITGTLFDAVRKSEGLDKKILHIGDDKKIDCDNAIQYGFDVVWLISNNQFLKKVLPNHILNNNRLSYDSLRNGLFQKYIAKFPVISNCPGYTKGKAYGLGYTIVGDIMVVFAAWILVYAKKHNIQHIYFFSRDGEIVKKVIDIIFKKIDSQGIKTHYLLASRRSFRVMSLQNMEILEKEVKLFIEDIRKSKDVTDIHLFLSLRFGFSEEKLIEFNIDNIFKNTKNISMNTNIEFKIKKWLLSKNVSNYILSNAKEEISLYKKYIEGCNLEINNNDKPIIFVDIGHNGTLQANLSSIFGLQNTHGLYFATYKEIDKNLESVDGNHFAFGYYRDRVDKNNRSDNYIKYALIVESLFLNGKTTFIKFSKNNNILEPLYLKENNNQRVKFNQHIHKGVADYTNDLIDSIIECFGKFDIELIAKSNDVCCRLFDMLSNPSYRDAYVFSNITIENYFTGRPIRFFVPPNGTNATGDEIWNEGTHAFITNDKVSDVPSKIRQNNNGNIKEKLLFRLEKKIVLDMMNIPMSKRMKYISNQDKFFSDSKNKLVLLYGKFRRFFKREKFQ
jgi:predicted HAD superfamily hydrolase